MRTMPNFMQVKFMSVQNYLLTVMVTAQISIKMNSVFSEACLKDKCIGALIYRKTTTTCHVIK